jgi:serine-type D-Ala-D-Ala carboxypeptidase/endopeptidase (penicillin-binding protein 4)
VIVGDFAMNFQRDSEQAGALLKQALDATQWPSEATYYFQQMPYGTRAPKIKLIGTVQVTDQSPANQRILLRHNSLALIQLLKQMNIYSNNDMAEMFGKELGGGPAIAERSAWYAGVPPQEIQLINGSGLGEENRISPRAAAALFRALQDELRHWQALGTTGASGNRSYTIADVFPVVGVDQGTVKDRNIPATAVVKTGTLNYVSALGGVLPTRDRGLVWFTIMNRGDGIEELRHQQDNFLQAIIQKWGLPLSPPIAVAPTSYSTAPKSGQDLADQS